MGPSFMKIWTCGSSPRSGSRNVWTRIKNVNGASRLSNFRNFFGESDPNYFLSRLVTMNETSLYHYDSETKLQWMEWQRNGSPHPKISECKHPLENLAPVFFCDQEGILLIDYLTKGQTINAKYYSTLLVRERHQGGLVLARQCPDSMGICNPEETGLPWFPMYWSPTLFSGSGSVGQPPVLWTEKQLKGRHFSPDAEVIATAETWLDGQSSDFLSGLQTLQQRTKKCIELRGEYLE